jgi:hypothetical protein
LGGWRLAVVVGSGFVVGGARWLILGLFDLGVVILTTADPKTKPCAAI